MTIYKTLSVEEQRIAILDAVEAKKISKRKLDFSGKGKNITRLQNGDNVSNKKITEIYSNLVKLSSDSQNTNEQRENLKDLSRATDDNLQKLMFDSNNTNKQRENLKVSGIPVIQNIKRIPIDLLFEHPENHKLLPEHTKDEQERLKNSIEKGFEQRAFIVLDNGEGRYTILDGNTRYKCLKALGYNGEVNCLVLGKESDWTKEQQRSYIEDCALSSRSEKITKKTKKAIAICRAARGDSQKDISQSLHFSQQWVSKHTAEVATVRKIQLKTACSGLRAAGKSIQEISEVLRVSGSAIKKWGNFTTNGKNVPLTEEQAKNLISASTILEIVKKQENGNKQETDDNNPLGQNSTEELAEEEKDVPDQAEEGEKHVGDNKEYEADDRKDEIAVQDDIWAHVAKRGGRKNLWNFDAK